MFSFLFPPFCFITVSLLLETTFVNSYAASHFLCPLIYGSQEGIYNIGKIKLLFRNSYIIVSNYSIIIPDGEFQAGWTGQSEVVGAGLCFSMGVIVTGMLASESFPNSHMFQMLSECICWKTLKKRKRKKFHTKASQSIWRKKSVCPVLVGSSQEQSMLSKNQRKPFSISLCVFEGLMCRGTYVWPCSFCS